MISSYKDLIVWQKAMTLAKEVYKVTQKFPREEIYGMTSQMRRAAVSIPSNIAEGRARTTRRDFLQFLRIDYGSGAELETQLALASRLEITEHRNFTMAQSLLNEVMSMLNVMIRKLGVLKANEAKS